ncbi:hypothetical protein TURU_002384 [Turdus rufiventris]|nr:hypothetical protein TURU_002384 [Turdus rufiventris]
MMLDPALVIHGIPDPREELPDPEERSQIQGRDPKSKEEIPNPKGKPQSQRGHPKCKGETPNAKGRPQIQSSGSAEESKDAGGSSGHPEICSIPPERWENPKFPGNIPAWSSMLEKDGKSPKTHLGEAKSSFLVNLGEFG